MPASSMVCAMMTGLICPLESVREAILVPEIALSDWRELPGRRVLAALEACAARYYGVADANNDLAVAGWQSAIE